MRILRLPLFVAGVLAAATLLFAGQLNPVPNSPLFKVQIGSIQINGAAVSGLPSAASRMRGTLEGERKGSDLTVRFPASANDSEIRSWALQRRPQTVVVQATTGGPRYILENATAVSLSMNTMDAGPSSIQMMTLKLKYESVKIQ